jgi:hypothetical protein
VKHCRRQGRVGFGSGSFRRHRRCFLITSSHTIS